MLGNFLGDFVRLGEEARYGVAMRRGIRLHRRIDGFTDAHPVFRRSRRRVRDSLRRYGGISVDLFYDHILAVTFAEYHEVNLEAFAEQVYRLLQMNETTLPPRLRSILPAMIRDNWLVSYRELEGIERALRGISRRLSRPIDLAASTEELRLHYDAFAADFREFFPEVSDFVRRERAVMEKGEEG